jgi:FixJ family two-component response regulator
MSTIMTHATPIVFVVDDDISVRESLEILIVSAGWEPRLFESAQDFLNCPRASASSCLLLDIGLPDVSGLDLQTQIAIERANMPIIFITGLADIPMTVRAMKAGAIEFLTKPFDDRVLLDAIAQAIERSSTLCADAAELALLRARHSALSRRESEVMALVVTGLLNKQIGFQLGISEITVKAHRGHVMRKMNAKSLAHLVNIAARLEATPRTSTM